MNIIIPMAGAGSRFAAAGYQLPKPFLPIGGKPMIEWVVDNMYRPNAKVILLARLEHLPHLAGTDLVNRNDLAIIPIEKPTEGAACTVLRAERFIDNAEPLLIVNSDQYVVYDEGAWCETTAASDGAIMTFPATETKWSYSRAENDRVVEVAEKRVISDRGTVGVYYYRQGSVFVQAVKQMIAKDIRTNGEFYICPAFNEIVSTHHVRNFDIEKMYGLGTPEDYEKNAPLVERLKRPVAA
jgi:NDP-sugar pyrophosphorylase family protein